MPHRRGWLSFALSFVVLGWASSAGAFCRTTTVPVPADYNPAGVGCWTEGKVLYWRSPCVSFSMQADASRQIPLDVATKLTTQAFDAWTTAKCNGESPSIGVEPFPTVKCSEVTYTPGGPNANAIIFRDDGWKTTDGFNTVALTTVTFNVDTGEIYDADVEINTFLRNFETQEPIAADSYDYLSAITHEAGHFLGLAHASSADTTMYALYRPGTTSIRTLSADDVDGICAIYPHGGLRPTAAGNVVPTVCAPMPRDGFSPECAPTGGWTPPVHKSGCDVAPVVPTSGSGGASGGRVAMMAAFALALSGIAVGRARSRRRT